MRRLYLGFFIRIFISIYVFSGVAIAEGDCNYGFVLPHKEMGQVERSSIRLALKESGLVAIHMDDGIPWYDLLSGKPLPNWLKANLLRIKKQIPKHYKISLAVTPTAQDRVNLAPVSVANDGGQELPMPKQLRGKKFDDPLIKSLYLKYLNELIDLVEPDYINVGIEISELAVRNTEKWQEFENLFLYILPKLKKQHPSLKVGIEMVLQSIMEPEVQGRILKAFTKGDYLGFSFYPYSSIIAEKFLKQKALPEPPGQWNECFQFMSTLSNKFGKPLAFCETGYLSHTVNTYGLDLKGSEKLQADFTKDLVKFAKKEDLLFVIWFVPVDYHQALMSIPKGYEEFKEAGKIWSYSGLWNENRTAKKALEEWRKRK